VFWSRVGGSADAEPSLATDGSRLYLAVKGLDSRIYVNIWSGSWSGWERIPTGSTKSGPAAAIRLVGGHLYVIVRGSDNRIYYTYRTRPNTYAPWSILGDATFSAPSAHDQHKVRIFLYLIYLY